MPLWADGLAEQPDRGFAEIFAEPVPAVPEDTAPAPTPEWPVVVFVAAAVLFTLVAAAWTATTRTTLVRVPSAWAGVPMRCQTLRIERTDGAVELLQCRANGQETLPPGRYGSPDQQWTSDLTRVDARLSRIRISPDGVLAGWAVY